MKVKMAINTYTKNNSLHEKLNENWVLIFNIIFLINVVILCIIYIKKKKKKRKNQNFKTCKIKVMKLKG